MAAANHPGMNIEEILFRDAIDFRHHPFQPNNNRVNEINNEIIRDMQRVYYYIRGNTLYISENGVFNDYPIISHRNWQDYINQGENRVNIIRKNYASSFLFLMRERVWAIQGINQLNQNNDFNPLRRIRLNNLRHLLTDIENEMNLMGNTFLQIIRNEE